jgi:hypothetical protein
MSSKIALKFILIFVISSVIVLGTEETKNDGINKAVSNVTSSSNLTSKSEHNGAPQFASEAGNIVPLESHPGGGKSRKRPPLTYEKPINESESIDVKKINSTTNTIKENVSEANKTSTTPSVDSSDHQKPPKVETSTQTKSLSTTVAPITSGDAKKINSTSQQSSSPSTSSTPSTTPSTTTTTTKKPIKKPLISINSADNPAIAQLEKKVPHLPPISIKENLVVEEPVAELSQERTVEELSNNRYILYITLVFALPCLVFVLTLSYRKFKDHWSTRQYRRVDFLVDGMYAD